MRRALHTRLALGALGALAVAACGDGLLGEAYRGEPRFSYAGQMATSGAEPLYQHPLRAGIFWLPYDPVAMAVEDSEATLIDAAGFARLGLPPDAKLVEQNSIAVDVAFPGFFELNVFADPPSAAYAADNGVSYGVLLIYEDANENEAYDDGELAGGGPSQMVYFARRAMASGDAGNGLERDVSPGYGLIELPLRCGEDDATFEPDPQFGVPVGAGCARDADCGAQGVCLLEDYEGPLPGGYCVVPIEVYPEPANDEPQPPEYLTLVESEIGGIELKAWYQTCSSSAECRLAYTCQQDVCLPDLQSSLLLDRRIEIEGTCAIEHEVERRQPGGR